MDTEMTPLEGPRIISPRVFGDERGFFVESFQQERYSDLLGNPQFVQDNLSTSQKGVLRGLHFQHEPHAQGKLVSVIKGAVYDVAVDIRPESETFGEWVGVELRGPQKNNKGVWEWQQFWIPPGFAHGFLVLEEDTVFAYKCSHSGYAPEHDAGLKFDDPDIGITWPAIDSELIISEKDLQQQSLADYKKSQATDA